MAVLLIMIQNLKGLVRSLNEVIKSRRYSGMAFSVLEI